MGNIFKNNKAFSSFAVNDLAKAKRFYGETLGLDVDERPEGLTLHIDKATQVFIYQPGQFSAPKNTVLNFIVDDIEATIDELVKKGIHMEQYDMPTLKTDAKGIVRGPVGPKAIAWFKDPAGNILSVIQEK